MGIFRGEIEGATKGFVMAKVKASTSGTSCVLHVLQEGGPKGRPSGLPMERRGSSASKPWVGKLGM